MVPGLRGLRPGQTLVPFQVTAAGWGYDVYDLATQAIISAAHVAWHIREVFKGEPLTA